jgi:predicted ArsR family transcriptional regulator
MRQTTRSRILDYLRKQRTASVRELSRALGMTGANIRHHLAVLESNYLVESIGQRQEGRGRPENIYGFSRRMHGDGLEQLAEAMLKAWLKDATEADSDAALRSIAIRLGGGKLPEPYLPLKIRLTRLVERLNELHYQARWEAGVDGPHLILGLCPYAAIIASNPELCLMDGYFSEEWTGLKVEQTARLQKSVKGDSYCAFRFLGEQLASPSRQPLR